MGIFSSMRTLLEQTKQDSADVTALKARYGYWDEWTSARWQRVENPQWNQADYPDRVLRYHPITGKWLPLTYNEAFDDSNKST
jgi:hypothetical protein